jgi:hypothetical protein
VMHDVTGVNDTGDMLRRCQCQETCPETILIFFDYSQRYSIISVLRRCQ